MSSVRYKFVCASLLSVGVWLQMGRHLCLRGWYWLDYWSFLRCVRPTSQRRHHCALWERADLSWSWQVLWCKLCSWSQLHLYILTLFPQLCLISLGRYWEMVERLKVNQLYLAPTALRLLLKSDSSFVTQYERSTLKTLGCGKFTTCSRNPQMDKAKQKEFSFSQKLLSFSWWTTQSWSLGMVLQRCWRATMSNRRHMVADGWALNLKIDFSLQKENPTSFWLFLGILPSWFFHGVIKELRTHDWSTAVLVLNVTWSSADRLAMPPDADGRHSHWPGSENSCIHPQAQLAHSRIKNNRVAETGGICITPRPSAPGAEIIPAMPMRPFFGIDVVLFDEKVQRI